MAATIEEEEKRRKDRNRKFQNACKIWFCPSDERIARELLHMPQEEREKVWADLSGNENTSQFRKEITEDPKKISKALYDMATSINDDIGVEKQSAYELAYQQNSEYVNNHSFRLMFLRSCEYDGKKAARKLVEHMEMRRRLFGDECLGRDIKLSDLNEEDMRTLQSGSIQFLPKRDTAGRLVLYGHIECIQYKERENLVRSDTRFNTPCLFCEKIALPFLSHIYVDFVRACSFLDSAAYCSIL